MVVCLQRPCRRGGSIGLVKLCLIEADADCAYLRARHLCSECGQGSGIYPAREEDAQRHIADQVKFHRFAHGGCQVPHDTLAICQGWSTLLPLGGGERKLPIRTCPERLPRPIGNESLPGRQRFDSFDDRLVPVHGALRKKALHCRCSCPWWH